MKQVIVLMHEQSQSELGEFATVAEAIASPFWTDGVTFQVRNIDESPDQAYKRAWQQVRDAAIVGAAQAIQTRTWGLVKQLEDIAKMAARRLDPIYGDLYERDMPDTGNRLYAGLMQMTVGFSDLAKAQTLVAANATRRETIEAFKQKKFA